MNKLVVKKSQLLYSLLLYFYPKNYRKKFGPEMQFVFSESLKDAYTQKKELGLVGLWIKTGIDALKSIPTEHLDNRKGGAVVKTNKDLISSNQVFLYIAGVMAAVLSLPYLAMQYDWVKPDPNNPRDRGVDWSAGDFVFMGAFIFFTGSAFVFVARAMPKKYRTVIALAFLLGFLALWAHLAVGLVDSWPLAGS